MKKLHLIALCGALALFAGCATPGGPGHKPNIIWIMADDLGPYDLGCYGQKLIKTPNIDRMAAEGMRFTEAYSGSTVCAPARSCLMTGQHTGHTRVRGNFGKSGRVPLRPEDVTVAEVLKNAGYTCGIVGKWGLAEPGTLGVPNKKGFDFWFGYLNQRRAHSYYPDYVWMNEEKYGLPGNVNGQGPHYTHDLMTREALRFVRQNKKRPFFLYMAYTIPHGKYEVPSIEPYEEESWPEEAKKYAAMVTRLDRDVGKLFEELEGAGIDDRTIVFFTSDNGPANGAGSAFEIFKSWGPLRGTKRDMYEGGIRVPMIARWPGRIEAGSTSDHPWVFYDFMPTACELGGAPPPKDIDGLSVAPVLFGKKAPVHDFFYWEFPSRGFMQAVRMGDWKAVRRNPKEKIELYSLKIDPGEKNDVSRDNPGIVAKMAEIMKREHVPNPEYPMPGE